MKMLTRLATIFLLASPFPAAAAAEPVPHGIWIIDSGKVTVQVDDCGRNLCGKIVALSKPLDKNGKPKLDKENPIVAQAAGDRITILSDMKPDGRNNGR
jgi:hypothetical protein